MNEQSSSSLPSFKALGISTGEKWACHASPNSETGKTHAPRCTPIDSSSSSTFASHFLLAMTQQQQAKANVNWALERRGQPGNPKSQAASSSFTQV